MPSTKKPILCNQLPLVGLKLSMNRIPALKCAVFYLWKHTISLSDSDSEILGTKVQSASNKPFLIGHNN